MENKNPEQTQIGKPIYTQINLKELDEIINNKIEKINTEFKDGFNFIKKHPKTVSIFGSARTDENDPDYITARKLANKISKELDYAVVTGGSVGIMEAANRGAFEMGGESLGMNIKLPKEQASNKYLTDEIEFHYFFVRKVGLSFAAEAYVYFPGGYGTLDELFEILTLVQTGKIAKVPIILVGSEFWNKFDFLIKETLLKNKKIDPKDIDLYKITDNLDEIIEIIRQSPIRIGTE